MMSSYTEIDEVDILNFFKTIEFEYSEALISSISSVVYGNSGNSYNYPVGVRHFDIKNSATNGKVADWINSYNNKHNEISLLLFKSNKMLFIQNEKKSVKIYRNSRHVGWINVLSKHRLSLCDVDKQEIASITYPKFWQFARYGEIVFPCSDTVVKYDTRFPKKSLFSMNIDSINNLPFDCQLLIVGSVFWRTTRTL